jgi:Arc/MetJ-type ribon-helix-helix transcriptional regulator
VSSSKKPELEVVLPVTVRLPKSVIERLESAAVGQGITRSEYVRALLVEAQPPNPSTLSSSSKDRTAIIRILREINRAGRQIESVVRILERAANGGSLNNGTVDRAAVEIASVDSTLREALAHAVKN